MPLGPKWGELSISGTGAHEGFMVHAVVWEKKLEWVNNWIGLGEGRH